LGNPAYSAADFIIKDAAKAVSYEAQKIDYEFKAITSLTTLLSTNEELCREFLKMLKIISPSLRPSKVIF